MRFLRPEPASPVAQLSDSARERLNADALREARMRIRRAAWIGIGAFFIFVAFVGAAPWLPGAEDLSEGELRAREFYLKQDGLGLAICLVLLGATFWKSRVSDGLVVHLLRGAQFIICTAISFVTPLSSYMMTGSVHPVSWVVPIVILVPLIVSTHPSVTVVNAAACAGTMPLAALLQRQLGWIGLRDFELVQLTIAATVAVGIAYVASRVTFAAGQMASAGKYRLDDDALLAEGGMGRVYRAEHGFLGRAAAVKIIHPTRLKSRADRELILRRFAREADVTASLRSPHTVEIYDFGETAADSPRKRSFFIAMELLDGENLEHFIYAHAADGMEPRRAVHWLLQACHSLGEAHAKDFVHRDVKPRNMMICRLGRDVDFLKVLDFGLTKPIAEGEQLLGGSTDVLGNPELTRTGLRLGTPGYMSPEQIEGKPAGYTSDIYALGCVAFFLLAGRKPFEPEDQARLGWCHVNEPPPPLSQVAKQRVPPRLEAIVMQCLEKDPEKRPGTVDELATALAGSLDGPPWSAGEARTWWAEHRPAGATGGSGPAAAAT